jgi:D-alanine-D-alanine ligase
MRIGLTYDLRDDYLAEGLTLEETAEFDRPDTIGAIDRTLRELGYRTERIGNIKHLTRLLAAGERWDLVFNIAEGLNGIGREAQVPALLDAYDIPYTFSDPLVLALTLHKGMTKRVVRDAGIRTPAFAVIATEAEAQSITLPFPLFAKPLAEGTGKGISPASKITTRARLVSVCRDLLATYRQPVIVETFLPGREFTVGIVGTGDTAQALAVMEVCLRENAEEDVYSYTNKEYCEEFVEYRLTDDRMAQEALEIAVAVYRHLGCRDAGRVDLRADAEGRPSFIEINPLAGLHPEHSDLPILCRLAGIGYPRLIRMIMESAESRNALLQPSGYAPSLV